MEERTIKPSATPPKPKQSESIKPSVAPPPSKSNTGGDRNG